jgi:hypothetical protein
VATGNNVELSDSGATHHLIRLDPASSGRNNTTDSPIELLSMGACPAPHPGIRLPL